MGRTRIMFSLLLIGLFSISVICTGVRSLFAWDKDSWLKLPPYEWHTANPELAEKWAKMVGFKAPDVVGKVAPEIKPGMVIDSKNYKNYPGLKKLLSDSLYARLDPNSYAPLAPLKIAPTSQYHWSIGCLEKTLDNIKTCRIAEDGITMIGYNGGIAFPHPKAGIELAWNMDNKYIDDTIYMNPMWLRLYGRDNKPERDMKWYLGQVRWTYRCDWGEDIKPNLEGVNYASSGWFFYPRDLSGTCYLRRRFLDVEKPDEFLLYLPSMRRIRRMSGKDTQDPIFGSDIVWDDFQGYYQKISATTFPVDWKIIGKAEILQPTEVHIDYRRGEERPPSFYVDDSGEQTYMYYGSWQRRPVWIVEGKELDKSYSYSIRRMYIDREINSFLHSELFDQAGRLWRTWLREGVIENHTGYYGENFIDAVDHLNNHRTILDCKQIPNPEWVGPEYSDMKFLIRKAK